MGFYWLASDVLQGNVLADLPKFDVPRVKKVIGRYEQSTGTLPLIGAPADWERIVTPGATHFHLLRDNPDDPAHGIPLWGGMITEAPLTSGNDVRFPMSTVEAYFDRRFIGDETYTQVGQNLIVKDIVEKYIADGPNGGLPIRVVIVNGGAGKLRDRSYLNTDDKTVYSVLTDLMGVIDGPEWTVGWEWQANPERITPVLYVGDRIGSAVAAGLSASAVFDMPGPVLDFQRYSSYAQGKGANVVMATSSGQGDERPQSPLQVTPDPLRPTFEHRFTPSTSIKEVSTLTGHAQSAAEGLANGTLALALVATADRAPKLDVDWFIGDDIGYNITAPAFPNGKEGVARAVGWELAPQGTATITPILVGGNLS